MSTLGCDEMRTVDGGLGRIGTYCGVEPTRAPPAKAVSPTAPEEPIPPTAPSVTFFEAVGSGGNGLPARVAQERRKSRSCGKRALCGAISGRIPTQIT